MFLMASGIFPPVISQNACCEKGETEGDNTEMEAHTWITSSLNVLLSQAATCLLRLSALSFSGCSNRLFFCGIGPRTSAILKRAVHVHAI